MGKDVEERILEAAVREFAERGSKFTMDDVARRLGMSKKTLYTVFESKEQMMLALVDRCFSDSRANGRAMSEDGTPDTVEKLEKLLLVLLQHYQSLGSGNLYRLSEKFPEVYRRAERYLQTDWDEAIVLLKQGMAEGTIREMELPVFKAMVESAIGGLFGSGTLQENGIRREEALRQMLQILLHGICTESRQIQQNIREGGDA